jgi:hypothetical protein
VSAVRPGPGIRQQVRRARARRPAQRIANVLTPKKRSATPTATRPSSSRPAAPARRDGYDWGNGSGGHSISLAEHRRHLEDKNPLYDPTTQLSGSALAQAARDLVGLEYDPQERQLGQELTNTTAQGTALAQRAGDYSAQVARNDAGVVTQQAAIKQLLDQSLGNNATAAQQVIDQNLQGSRDRAAADAAIRGVSTPDATAGVERETAAAAGTVAANRQVSGDANALATAANQTLAVDTAGAHAQMGQEVQGQLLNRLANAQADVRTRQAGLATDRGAATSKATIDLRQQAYENLITQQGLNIKTKELQAETQHQSTVDDLAQKRIDETGKSRRSRERIATANRTARADADAAARKAIAERQGDMPTKYGYTNAEWARLPIAKRQQIVNDFNKSPKPGQKMSDAARQKRTRIDSMLTDIGTDPKLQRHVGQAGPRLTQILTNRGADPLEAQAAAEIAKHGHLTPATEARLRRAGIRIPSKWRATTPAPTGGGSGNNPVSRTGRGDFK